MIWQFLFFGFIGLAAIWSMWKPGVAIGLLICMYGIESFLQTRDAFFIDNGTYVNIAIGMVMVFAVTASLLRVPYRLRHVDVVQILSIALYCFGFLSYFWTMAPEEFFRWKGCVPYLLVFLILAPILTREPDVLRNGLRWAMIIGTPLMLASAFYCEWGLRGMILAKPIIENGRTIIETPPLAIATLASALGIITLVVHLKIPFPMIFRFAVLGVAIYLAFLTRSRGQVVAIIGVAAVVYPISNQATNVKGFFITMVGLTVFSVIVFYIVGNLDLVRWRQDQVEDALIGRQEMWVDLFSYWLDKPGKATLFGLGICSSFRIVGFYPHNLPIEILAELGLVGFLLYGSVLYKSFSNSLNLLSKLEKLPENRGVVIATIGLIGVAFALSLKEGSLFMWAPFFFYTICLSQQVRITAKITNVQKQWFRALFVQNRSTGVTEESYRPPIPTPHDFNY